MDVSARNGFIYQPVPLTEMEKRREEMRVLAGLAGSRLKIEIDTDENILRDVVIQVDRESARWYIFENGTVINHVKKACLQAHYIYKLKPFSVKSGFGSFEKQLLINETIAFWIPVYIIRDSMDRKVCVHEKFYQEVILSMRYAVMSTEALIHLFEVFLHHEVRLK